MKLIRNKLTGQLGEVFHIAENGKEYRVKLDNDRHTTWDSDECELINFDENEISSFEKISKIVGKTVTEKNQAYGNSFEDVEKFLKLLYPNGITVEKYGDMLCIVRIFDKLKRIATKKDAFGESPYFDIAGYAILGIVKDEKNKQTKD